MELIRSAKQGNSKSTDELLMKYKHLVTAKARKYFLMGGDQEDIIQEGMIGLFSAINSYDFDKCDSFEAYASVIIERAIISAIKSANTLTHKILSDSVFVSSDEIIKDNYDLEKDLITSETVSELTAEIYKNLSPLESKVTKLYLMGYNYKDIANILKKSPKSIDNALTRIKEKLKYLKERL